MANTSKRRLQLLGTSGERGMNLKEIKDLIDLIKGSEVVELEVERSGFRVKLRKGEAPLSVPEKRPAASSKLSFPAQEGEPAPQEYTVTTTVPPETDKYVVIVSPIVGTFYRAAAPDKEPYVEIGDTVKKGQIVCIIEAMKLMNEIESEVDGKVVEILVENERSVEYGEPLFRIEPLS